MRKVLAAVVVVAAVVAALAGASTSAAFNRNLVCSFAPHSSAHGANTVCTYDSAYRTTEQNRCTDGIFSTRMGEHYSTVVWTIRGNVARKLDGIYPSGASAVPGVQILTTSASQVQHWDDWQSLSAEASAAICAGGDFQTGDPD